MSTFFDELAYFKEIEISSSSEIESFTEKLTQNSIKKLKTDISLDDVANIGHIQLAIRLYSLKQEIEAEKDVIKRTEKEKIFEKSFRDGRFLSSVDNTLQKFDVLFVLVESLCSSLNELDITTQELNETKIKLEAYEQQEKRSKENKTGKRSRLSSEDFQTIQRRKADGEKYKDIAPDYGYTPQTLANLIYQHGKKENGISFSDEDYRKENFTTQKKKVRKNTPTPSPQS